MYLYALFIANTKVLKALYAMQSKEVMNLL